MRSTKLFATLIALATAVLLTVGLMAPTTAQAAPARPKHKIVSISDKKVTNHKFIVYGKFTLKNRKFTVTKRAAHAKIYRYYAKPTAQRSGKFRFTITGNLGDCFKMRLPGTGTYKATTVSLGCIHRIS